jgi:hypothetical protein
VLLTAAPGAPHKIVEAVSLVKVTIASHRIASHRIASHRIA